MTIESPSGAAPADPARGTRSPRTFPPLPLPPRRRRPRRTARTASACTSSSRRTGAGSRRECETFIEQGRVAVNGKVVTKMGVKVDPAKDEVRLDGERVKPEDKVYYLLHKPPGTISTNSDERGRPRVDRPRARRGAPHLHGRPARRGQHGADPPDERRRDRERRLPPALPHREDLPGRRARRGRPRAARRRSRPACGWRREARPPRACARSRRNPRRNETLLEITLFEGRNREVRRVFAPRRAPGAAPRARAARPARARRPPPRPLPEAHREGPRVRARGRGDVPREQGGVGRRGAEARPRRRRRGPRPFPQSAAPPAVPRRRGRRRRRSGAGSAARAGARSGRRRRVPRSRRSAARPRRVRRRRRRPAALRRPAARSGRRRRRPRSRRSAAGSGGGGGGFRGPGGPPRGPGGGRGGPRPAPRRPPRLRSVRRFRACPASRPRRRSASRTTGSSSRLGLLVLDGGPRVRAGTLLPSRVPAARPRSARRPHPWRPRGGSAASMPGATTSTPRAGSPRRRSRTACGSSSCRSPRTRWSRARSGTRSARATRAWGRRGSRTTSSTCCSRARRQYPKGTIDKLTQKNGGSEQRVDVVRPHELLLHVPRRPLARRARDRGGADAEQRRPAGGVRRGEDRRPPGARAQPRRPRGRAAGGRRARASFPCAALPPPRDRLAAGRAHDDARADDGVLRASTTRPTARRSSSWGASTATRVIAATGELFAGLARGTHAAPRVRRAAAARRDAARRCGRTRSVPRLLMAFRSRPLPDPQEPLARRALAGARGRQDVAAREAPRRRRASPPSRVVLRATRAATTGSSRCRSSRPRATTSTSARPP